MKQSRRPLSTERQRDAKGDTHHAASIAAVGLALLDAASLQARTKPIEGVRLTESAQPASSGDTYQDGRALLASGDIAGAIAAFRTTLIAAPQSIDALNGLAVAYDRIGRYDVSRSYYDAALAINPDAAQVLNNLGYSLYLQGQYQAAIPLLQQATASADSGARNNGQRVLNLIAAKMRGDAGAASTKVALAEIARPQMRIEQGVSGEQRLVLAAPAPDAALVASLGDAAALVMIAKPLAAPREDSQVTQQADVDRRTSIHQLAVTLAATPRTQPFVRPSATAITAPLPENNQAAVITAATQTAPIAPTVIMATASPLPASPLPAASLPDSGMNVEAAARVAAAVNAKVGSMVTAGLTAIIAASEEIDTATASAARRAAERGSRRSLSFAVPADLAFQKGTMHPEEAPAWLLASRRDPRASDAPADTAQLSHDHDTTVAFDSDDGDLNIFAARMRGATPDVSVSADEAVTRLEGLLRRIRTA